MVLAMIAATTSGVALAMTAERFLGRRSVLGLLAALLLVTAVFATCAKAATVLLVDKVAVHAPCTPMAWEGNPLRLECHGIIFRGGFDP